MLELIKKSYKLIILLAFGLVSCFIEANAAKTETQGYNLPYPKRLIELAKSIDAEPIAGDKFLHSLRANNGQGLPYIFSRAEIIKDGQTSAAYAILFWCRRDNQVFLVYAIDESEPYSKKCNYVVKEIIPYSDLFGYDATSSSTYGMIAYDDILGVTIELSNFTYLDNPKEYGPKNIYPTYLNGFSPIIIHQDNFTLVLYRYKNKWLKYIKVDV